MSNPPLTDDRLRHHPRLFQSFFRAASLFHRLPYTGQTAGYGDQQWARYAAQERLCRAGRPACVNRAGRRTLALD